MDSYFIFVIQSKENYFYLIVKRINIRIRVITGGCVFGKSLATLRFDTFVWKNKVLLTFKSSFVS